MVGKDTITGMGFIGLEHGRFYKMRRGPNVIIATITGRRIVLEKCAGGKLRGLILYGKSTQVTTTGAQLLNLVDREPATICGLTWHIKNQCISVNGTATDGGNVTDFYICGTRSVYADVDFPEGRITISADLPKDIVMYVVKNSGTTLTYIASDKKDGSFEHVSGSKYRILLRARKKGAIYNNVIKAMFNRGDTALPWEPYTGGKPSPSPDYPQEIRNAGDDGSIGVEVHGKNIFGGRYYYAMYSNGILFIDKDQKDKEVKFPYQPESETRGICKALKCQKGKTYVISVTNPNKNATVGMTEYENIEKAIDVNKALGFAKVDNKILKKSYTAKSDGILVCGIAGTWTDGKTTLHECTESELLQVEEASEATSYEPYHNPQTLTLSAPNGLPGIMVTSGGNYTDENGQQWICDEVDFAGGVYRQRIKHVNIVFNKVASSATHSGYRHVATNIQNMSRKYTECLCNIATYSNGASNGTEGIRASGEYNTIVLYYENLTNDNIPADVAYILSDPIETPLSETDIAAYRALTIYDPTTIVETNSGGLKVSYNKIVKN